MHLASHCIHLPSISYSPCYVLAQAIIVRAEPLLRVEDVQIDLMKGIGSVGESINVNLKLFSALEEVMLASVFLLTK